MKSSAAIEIEQKSRNSFLKYYIIIAVFVIVGFAYSIYAKIIQLSIFGDYDQWYADWYAIADSLKYGFLNNGAGLAALPNLYHHWFTPLFPICIALIDFVTNNSIISALILNGILTIMTIIVLKKIFVELFHLKVRDAMIALIIYQSNLIISNDTLFAWGGTDTMPFVAFCVALAFYTNVKFIDNINYENGIKISLVNTLVMYCREIIWPVLLLNPILILLKIMLKQDNTKLRSLAFIKRELNASYFAVILPSICYSLFVVFGNAIPSILWQLQNLISFSSSRYISPALVNVILAYNFMPLLVLIDIKGILRKKEGLPFITWLCFFIIVRLIMPGGLWAAFWEPNIFCFCPLCMQSLREGHLQMKDKYLVPILIATNLAFELFAISFPYTFIMLTSK